MSWSNLTYQALATCLYIILSIVWLMGFVLAPTWWLTVAAVLPPVAFYFVVEHFMVLSGLIIL